MPELVPVPRIEHPRSWEEFHRDVLAHRRPVLMRAGDYFRRALDTWSFDYLVERVGADMIGVEVNPANADTPEDFHGIHEEMSVREFIARLRDPLPGKVHYYAENHVFLDLPALVDDVDLMPFVPGPLITKTAGIVGTIGAYSFGHLHGLTEAILTQFVGKKRLWLWDEQDAGNLHLYDRLDRWNLSAIGFRQRAPIDLDAFPNYRNVSRVYEAVLEPGDMLYIPTFSVHNAWCETAENIALTTFWTSNPSVFTTETQLRLLAMGMVEESARYLDVKSRSSLAEVYRLGMSAAAQRVMGDLPVP